MPARPTSIIKTGQGSGDSESASACPAEKEVAGNNWAPTSDSKMNTSEEMKNACASSRIATRSIGIV
ncbi:hypothetical protein VCV18_001739 [Metarhizium anisopliae]